jgi:membrane associated rhomboid family serine protease
MFMHDTHSFTHVFFNMFAVYMFGRVLENLWGSKLFFIYYIVAGVGAGLIQELVWLIDLRDVLSGYGTINLNGVELPPKSEYLNFFVKIGASGAVFGVLLAFGVLFPSVSLFLVIINLLLFWIARLPGIDLVNLLGLHFPGAKSFNPVQLITYIFMHDPHSFTHIFFNMFAVYMFGRVLEKVWGPKRFLVFYMVTGIGAGLIQELVWFIELRDVIFSGYDTINQSGLSESEFLNFFITIGASGAVFGILLAFGVLYSNVPLKPIPIKAKYFVIGYGLIELLMGVAQFEGDPVAHFAHLGGMLFGYIMIRYWKKKGRNDGTYIY